MVTKTMQDALNAQINAEQYSAQLYLAMSAAMESSGFRGFAHWMRIQAGEETSHAMRLVDHVLARGGKLELRPLAAPPAEFGGPIQIFEEALKHEQGITAKINALFELARSDKDYATEIALQWYVTEQVEEEANAGLLVDRLHAVGDKGGAIWYLDKEVGKRGKD